MSRRALFPSFFLSLAVLCGALGIATAPLGTGAGSGCAVALHGSLHGAGHCPSRTLAIAEAPGAELLVGLESTSSRKARRGPSESFGGARPCVGCATLDEAPHVLSLRLSASSVADGHALAALVRAGLSDLPPPV